MAHTRPIALVTGASRGIGRGIALSLGGIGYALAINYVRDAQAAQDVARQVELSGSQALCVQADIGTSADRQRLVDQVLQHFGHVDLLVNNAGVAPAVRADLLEAGEESFDRLISINLKGPYFLTQRIAREMIARQIAGKIITISSVSAYAASVNRGDYCIAKAGLSMMTALYAARLAEHGIGVYEIRPGIIETDMTQAVKARYDELIRNGLTPIPRWGTPDDVAKAVVAIAMGLFPFSTGQVINVDGGFHLRRL